MLIDTDFIKKLEQQEVSYRSVEVEETAAKPKVVPVEPTKIKSAMYSCSYYNPATNWWLALIAFLLFLMLCLNPNFE
ncbi:MAG: hypothetical protein IKA83_06000 [Paludibacteraceae bacterium]|nr:hypothetical protein [Paludibacteraceae bacterium]